MPIATAEIAHYGPHREAVRPSLDEARAYCRRLAREHYENFTVASWLLPRRLRQHFANVYAYCRWADDLADESGDANAGLALLDGWEEQLRECFAGRAAHPVFVALEETIREFKIPIDPFTELLSAFRQDQHTKRYETFEELLDYCRRSANPVGRLVLHMGRCHNEQTAPLSDSVCTGLQLINFCQDVKRDWDDRQRIYLPQEILRAYGASERSITAGANRADEALRGAIADVVARAEVFLSNGWPLINLVSPELRIDVELFIRGGLAVAAAIRRQRFDALARRPRIGRATKLRLLAQAWWRQRGLRIRGGQG